MKNRIGILVAGLVTAVAIGLVGFQAGAEKSGVVDMNAVMQQSNFGKTSQENLNKALEARRELLDFVSQYRLLTMEQAVRMRELWVKGNRTAAETQELDRLKSDAQASDRRLSELSTKTTGLTDQERALMADFGQRRQTMGQVLQRWNAEMEDELRTLQEQARTTVLERARTSLREVARQQGFTTVFETSIAPYGSNDLTEATIKQMNSRP